MQDNIWSRFSLKGDEHKLGEGLYATTYLVGPDVLVKQYKHKGFRLGQDEALWLEQLSQCYPMDSPVFFDLSKHRLFLSFQPGHSVHHLNADKTLIDRLAIVTAIEQAHEKSKTLKIKYKPKPEYIFRGLGSPEDGFQWSDLYIEDCTKLLQLVEQTDCADFIKKDSLRRLGKLEAALNPIKTNEDVVFIHGDLTSLNMIVDDQDINFIDPFNSRFTHKELDLVNLNAYDGDLDLLGVYASHFSLKPGYMRRLALFDWFNNLYHYLNLARFPI